MNFYYQKTPRPLVFALVALNILLLLALLWCCFARYKAAQPLAQALQFPVFQKGATYAEWTKEGYFSFTSDDSLRELAKTNTEWVALTVTWYQDKYNSTEINSNYRTPSDTSIIHAIDKIHELGMKVMLKPHLDLIDVSGGRWRGDIEFEDPAQWQAWFDNYRNFILHYLKIADAQNVELFCLGTELASSTLGYPEKWQELILDAREIFRGDLTYAANWHQEYSQINFWELLDYAGVDPYFPLTETKSPSVEELKQAWQPWVRELEAWQSKVGRPVIFTEAGYKSCEAAANNPWEHMPQGKIDLQAQANSYQALLETFYSKKWLWGIYWWHWQAAINPSLSLGRGFTFRGKPAEAVVARWYRKKSPAAGKNYYLRASREAVSLGEKRISPAASLSPQAVAEANVSAPAPSSSAEGILAPRQEEAADNAASASAEISFKVASSAPALVSAHSPAWHKGMSYMTWSENSLNNSSSDESLALLKGLGVEWVSLSPTWYQDKYDSLDIQPNNKTPTDASLVHAIKKIHELGMKVMLKPHIDLMSQQDGRWRGGIEFASEEHWEAWFKSYANFIMHYAGLAKDNAVDLFCVGTELTVPATTQTGRWRQLIPEIRMVYPGPLTYAANWYDEYSRIAFWDLLDYAGVDPYFPLLEAERPSLQEIKESWQLWKGLLREWQAKINKPVIFPEVGYKSCTYTTDQPWLGLPSKAVDLRLQRDCYQAVLETFWDEPWFYGLYWWYWGTHPKMGGELNREYTPQNKPAQELLREWYGKAKPHQ